MRRAPDARQLRTFASTRRGRPCKRSWSATRSALRVSRAALPHLTARGSGVIVLIASVYGRASGGGPSYNVAKAAEISLAKAMARDLAKDDIRLVSVAPGSVPFPGGG